MKEQKRTKYLFSTSYQQAMSSHFLGNRTSVCLPVAPEYKYRNNEYLLTPPHFLLAFTAEQTSYGTEYRFGPSGSAALAVSPPKVLPSPSTLDEVGSVGETALTLCERCSAVAKTLVCYQHLPSGPHKAQHDEGCYREC